MSKQILIVDDSAVSRMMLISHLKKIQPTWVFIEASSGELAVEVASRTDFHGISMDINMVGISGLEAAETILGRKPETIIAVLSANVQQAIRAQAEKVGVTFIQKPVTQQTAAQIASLFGG